MSYHTDPRVIAAERKKPSFDEEAMTIMHVTCNDDGEEVAFSLPAKFVRCDLCEGRGKHVDPRIDCDGISDWGDDPDFRMGYFSGAYDVQCNECCGRRVVPVVNEKAIKSQEDRALYELWLEDRRFEAEYERVRAKERAMGY